MICSSKFSNLEWTSIEKDHSQCWKKLEAEYKLSPKWLEPPKSLDDLAQQCIRLCRKRLFYDTGISMRGWKMQEKRSISCVVDMEDVLGPALCDHLIVTFAHRFFCDNLEPKDIRKCLAAIYDCQGNHWEGTKLANDKDFQREQKKNAIDANSRKCRNYQKGVMLFITSYKSWIEQLHTAEEGGRLSSGTAAMLNQEFTALDAWLERKDLFAAPNWLFTVVMANNWKNHPFNVKNRGWTFARDYAAKVNLAERLVTFLGGNIWSQLLLPKNPIFQNPKTAEYPIFPLELGGNESSYVCIPYTPDGLFDKEMPAQKYALRGSQKQMEIPADVQRLFNSYLLEQNFHGYAIAVALDRIKTRLGSSVPNKTGSYGVYLDRYFALPFAIRLHAPLIHPELIRVIDDVISQVGPEERDVDCLEWLDWLISRWNREALPVLEELFFWGVHTYFDFDTLLSKLNESLAQRGTRLNRYRLISTHTDAPTTEYEKAQTPMINEIIKNGYLAGLGLKYADDPYSGIRVDPGMRTVFDG